MKNSVCYEIKFLDNLLERSIMLNCRDENSLFIGPVQMHILKYLMHNEFVYQRDLEKKFKFRRSTALGILRTMEKNNLILREECEDNIRLKRISITDLGIKQAKTIYNKMIEFENSLIKNISASDLSIFINVIHKMKDNVVEVKK